MIREKLSAYAKGSGALDLALALLILGLCLPLLIGALDQMSRKPVSFTAVGVMRPPRRAGGLWILRAIEGEPVEGAEALQLVLHEAELRGYRALAPANLRHLEPPLILFEADGTPLLLLARAGASFRLFDPRYGEGVLVREQLEVSASTRVRPLVPVRMWQP